MAQRPSFVPRDLLQHPEDFGVEVDAEWKLARTLGEAALLARAIEQHQLAVALKRKLRHARQHTPKLAEVLGTRRETLWRKLTGENPATENDLIIWTWLIDPPDGLGRRTIPPFRTLLADDADVAVPEIARLHLRRDV